MKIKWLFSRGGSLPPLLLAVLLAGVAMADRGLIDDPMADDPRLPEAVAVRVFHPRLVGLWLEALNRPDAATRLQAAAAFGEAYLQGMESQMLAEVWPVLIDQLASEPHAEVRLAMARSLIQMQVRDAVDVLAQRNAGDGQAMILLTDPVLAAWQHQPAVDRWLERISSPDVSAAVKVSAMRSLGELGVQAAAGPLEAIVRDAFAPANQRLAAAAALGQIQSQGLEALAQTLADQEAVLSRLLAGTLLQAHDTAEAQRLLARLGRDDEPAVAYRAAARLLAVNPGGFESLARRLLSSTDTRLRQLAVEYWAYRGDAAAVLALGPVLDDTDPQTRATARGILANLHDKADLAVTVQRAATAQLATASWRSLEQAAWLAGQIDHRPATARLVELLAHDRHEVRLAAAVVLRQFADESTLPALLEHAQRLAGSNRQPGDAQQINDELYHVLQMFGLMRYAPADTLLRQFVPKSAPFLSRTRTAAIWALGHIHAGEADDALVRQLISRLNDGVSEMPEDDKVRSMAAISLGRMNARRALGRLQHWGGNSESVRELVFACRWAISQVTGEPAEPLAEPGPSHVTGWFLEPLDQARP